MTDAPDARLDWSEPGAPRSRRFGDVYYSMEDGLAESRAVFLEGCGLPDAWRGRSGFTVAELGFGTGLNIAALLHLWRESGATGRLHVFSVEGFPVSRQDAARALSAWPDIAEDARALLTRWPDATPGFHRMDLPGWNATIDLFVGDVAQALAQWSGMADAWFLDGFSPALNPDMWSDAVLDGVAARSAPGARVATFTVAGAVRRGLTERGFEVHKRPGHGRKRERLEAALPGKRADPGATRVAVLGAGVAGASMVRSLRALGLDPLVIAEATRGASGFPAALATPRLDVGDEELAQLFAQALERAGQLYDGVAGAVVSRGVLRLEHGDRDAGRFDKVARQPIWGSAAMTRMDAARASGMLGEAVRVGGLMMHDALTVRPPAILDAWLAGAPRVTARAARLERSGADWRVLGEAGEVLARAGAVVLAAGWGAAGLGVAGLQPVRGQAGWADLAGAPAMGAAWGGYAAPTGEGVLFGATHDRNDTDEAARDADDQRNLETLKAMLPQLAGRLGAGHIHRHAAIRATTRDRLPVAGRLEEGLFVLGGLGSRGFTAAPLLADHVASLIADTPSPLPRALARRVAPDRPGLASR
ncbi:MAG: tRNA (5-methylaminomethyl-2-thiouridine)(34)-methyltransferase MnmD [Brevundimonas sp.]|uniref:tRNA (5-methylaminomethyl-2-thiouridine)(34)-methyltransferase MnmD n=1 Tax=Brevundimonas sp. TaxID=1871086 RepID=UPI003919D07D